MTELTVGLSILFLHYSIGFILACIIGLKAEGGIPVIYLLLIYIAWESFIIIYVFQVVGGWVRKLF